MRNKICLITGANSGIGLATAEGLAKKGAHVVMLCRNVERGELARQSILQKHSNATVDLMIADLSSLQDIRLFAQAFNDKYAKLDVFINNAGGMFQKKQYSKDGFEMTFAINYLAPFLMTQLLLDKLSKSEAARVVNLASMMQAKQINLDEVADPSSYSSMKVYMEAKLAVLLMTYYMSEQFKGHQMTFNALHPGAVYTPQASRIVPEFVKPLLKLFMSSPEKGARLSLYLATSPEVANISGCYYVKHKATNSVPISYDKSLQMQLFEQSHIWTGLA